MARVRVDTSNWFGTFSSVHTGSVGTFVTVGPAGTTVAAESHRVGEGGVGIDRTAGQYGCAVLHLVIGTTSLDEEAWAQYIPHITVLHEHRSTRSNITIMISFTFQSRDLFRVLIFR